MVFNNLIQICIAETVSINKLDNVNNKDKLKIEDAIKALQILSGFSETSPSTENDSGNVIVPLPFDPNLQPIKPKPSSLNSKHSQESIPYSYLPDNDIGNFLRQHFLNATAFGESAEDNYKKSLQLLKEHSLDAIDTLLKAYENLNSEQYFTRWLIVNTISQLESENAIAPLGLIAKTKIPVEKYNVNKIGYSSVQKEVIIRLAAVRGLSLLARKKFTDAENALVHLSIHGENNALKIMSIQGYLSSEFNIKKFRNWTIYQQSPQYSQRLMYLKNLLSDKDKLLLKFNPLQKKYIDAFKVNLNSSNIADDDIESKKPTLHKPTLNLEGGKP